MLSKLRAWRSKVYVLLSKVRDCVLYPASLIALGSIVILICFVTYAHPLRISIPAFSSIIAALISVIAVMSNEAAKYCSSTSTLEFTLNVSRQVYAWLDQHHHWYRVSAVVSNNGRVVIKSMRASLTIKVKKDDQETHLNEVSDHLHCSSNIINEYGPRIVGKLLPWLIPSKAAHKYSTSRYAISISPGQSVEVLIFDFEGTSDGTYLVKPLRWYGAQSQYGQPTSQYWACLRLDKDHEFIFGVTVHGEGARSPLQFKLCIDSEKLANIENTIGDFEKLLKALNNLKC